MTAAHSALCKKDEQTFMRFFLDRIVTEFAARLSPRNQPVNIAVVIISLRAIIRPPDLELA